MIFVDQFPHWETFSIYLSNRGLIINDTLQTGIYVLYTRNRILGSAQNIFFRICNWILSNTISIQSANDRNQQK
jgi:hypothetical protein